MPSHIAAEEEDNVPDKVRCDEAKWKEIGGLAPCDENCKLIVLDSGFCSIRVIANVGQLCRRPKTVLHIMRLTIHRNDFKGQLQRFYNLLSYERAFKMLKNNMCITEIRQAVLEL